MVTIRLARGGAKNAPFYRIVAIEKSRKRGGRPLEVLGFWHPAKEEIKVDKTKIKAWVEKGAKVSKAVDDLLKK